jgi:predicted 3-demethylubiquinone-9 3-methyltransferase (glyoxalase superfamily)
MEDQPMSKLTPCLWFASEAEEAANFYTALIGGDSHVDQVQRNPVDGPGGKAGTVLVVEFTLNGRPFTALNGGQNMPYTDAVSFSLQCEDQAEVDRLWDGLSAGGKEVQCGWLKDRYGVSWQIVPKQLGQLLGAPDRAAAGRAMQAMLKMVKLDIAALQQAFDGR